MIVAQKGVDASGAYRQAIADPPLYLVDGSANCNKMVLEFLVNIVLRTPSVIFRLTR